MLVVSRCLLSVESTSPMSADCRSCWVGCEWPLTTSRRDSGMNSRVDTPISWL
ncbi:hypothetical protein BTHE_1928 [Bifidobacterium thermophilum]|nr:hypothetical protein BTHE_1928 [Bifidobacterium thermophilum]